MNGGCSVIIMAAGQSDRWRKDLHKYQSDLPESKHLVPLPDGSRVIERQVRQWTEAGIQPVIITINKTLLLAFPEIAVQPERHGCLCESILSSSNFWEDETLISLGDVVYSQEEFQTLSGYHKPEFALFGHPGCPGQWTEHYAFYFQKQDRDLVFKALSGEADRFRKKEGSGKLNDFYRAICGSLMMTPYNGRGFVPITDWTSDVDFIPRFEKLCEDFKNHGGQ